MRLAFRMLNRAKVNKFLNSEKTIVFIASFFTSMVFLWSSSKMVYDQLDLMYVYCGTLGLLLGPMIVYIVKEKRKQNKSS